MALSKFQSIDVAALATSFKESLSRLVDSLLDYTERCVVPAAKEHQVLVAVALVTLSGHVYYWHKFSFWSRRNIKTPKPVPVFGNFLQYILKYRQHLELEWPKKYGKVYGFYHGAEPRLIIADAQILKKISIKDFSSFPNHLFFTAPNKYQRKFLALQKDDHWRGMRAILTPTFSSGRMKVMYKLMHENAEQLCREHLRRVNHSQEEINAREIYGSYSMSTSLKSFFGLSLSLNPDLLKQEEANQQAAGKGTTSNLTASMFAKKSHEAASTSLLRYSLTNLLPRPFLELIGYYSVSNSQMDFFALCVQKLIKDRKQAKSKFNDYLQLLLDAKADDAIEEIESGKHEEHHIGEKDTQLESWRPSKMRLTDEEVLCQGMMLMLVATETTGALISHIIYLLAHHQDIQERLAHELLGLAKNEEHDNNGQPTRSFTYDDLISHEYLDCVISESLRLMSPAVSMDRVASEDYYIEEYDLTVPRGTVLQLAFYAIHQDPDYWPEPTKYDPERFRRANKHKIVPGSYAPFGIGARACIGYRFALAEAKVGLAKLLCDFKFVPAPNTKYPPEPAKPVLVLNEFRDLRVRISKRNQ